jgi:hypothetical protein
MTCPKNLADISRELSRLDRWILVLVLLWMGAGIALLLEAHSSHRQGTQPAGYATVHSASLS